MSFLNLKTTSATFCLTVGNILLACAIVGLACYWCYSFGIPTPVHFERPQIENGAMVLLPFLKTYAMFFGFVMFWALVWAIIRKGFSQA
jgi:hypothetical protein